ncbi:MAG: anti-sigma factor family protein [Actinomycetota bacterium]
MNCRSLVELVTEYLEDALGHDERAAVEAHLAGCEGCTAYLEQMRTTIRLTGRLSDDQIPSEAREPLRRVFRAWRST